MSGLDDVIRRANEERPHITPEQVKAAHDVLGVLSPTTPGAWTPGNFTTKLIEALCVADRENSARIGLVFPELAEAVHLYKNVSDGVAVLSERAVI